MSQWWIKFKQRLYPAEFRIPAGDEGANLAVMLAQLIALTEAQAQSVGTAAALPVPHPVPQEKDPTPPGKPDEGFAIDLCNQVHRLSRSVAKLQEAGGPEAERLKGHLERLGKFLAEHSIQWEDLTGQAYNPGRSDFEPLGEPQVAPGLRRPTIILCERPLIRLGGRLIQPARGTVGKPAD